MNLARGCDELAAPRSFEGARRVRRWHPSIDAYQRNGHTTARTSLDTGDREF